MATEITPGEKSEVVGEINKYDFRTENVAVFKVEKGINADIVRQISEMKDEPQWMLDFRLEALEIFESKPMPEWGGDIDIDFQDIYYYLKPTEGQGKTWDEVPAEIKETFERLGIPQAEREYLAGVKAQFDSEVIYGSVSEDLDKLGVIFTDTDTALKEHPELLREYFGTIIPSLDNKFAALNSAVWSGGSFIYIPPGVKIEFPLQAYFRINAQNMGQFERTLIIVDEGAEIHYVEGCTAPMYSSDSLHSAVVEVICKKNARCRYTTIQNWANNIYNLVTKRAVCMADATMEWVDGNLGSQLTMKYPAVYMMEPGAHGEILSIAFSGKGQHQDAGAKLVHVAPNTTGQIISKSISKDGGRSSYRGLVRVEKGAHDAKNNVVCDALILDADSRSDTYPYIEVMEQDVSIGHEASVSRIGEEQLFYLTSRGLSEAEASAMIVNGFIEPLVKELPMEYAVEMNRLIQLQMEGSVG
ncbi:MAG: Fe-S cluster assembly protein SufB [Planctomycetaceae bacterium]|jgi:Fe-S cluster assembly protein SufB|nr:Fe-S cluster assembly protein SufB [Planctomycetaceae bacterium]MBT4724145.1 Fe-S cluster assembly protein SufB [Planctomycetaceae bacterium]MBT5125311.1 Fe-S cluster assembly protein SufB [Planctomycetaceae bacterium]MBT5598891.1 Fe-S cluster assembly protein SufB [Planctomycetaceae bacterium]MBT5884511.1 Fe-S cluster assembly protein SufB [Planctomycetaceae bacterium]